VPANIQSIKSSLLESKTLFQDVQDSLHDEREDIIYRLIYWLIAKKTCSQEQMLGKPLASELKRKLLRFKGKGNPPLLTHDLYNEESDSIIKAIISAGLLNREEDRVKVIFYPIYLTGADKLLNLSYNECIQGSHLGVFPSYYEPWGYTPMETAALGVSSVTTDLTGFGRYICREERNENLPGIFVVKRFNRKDEEVVNELSEVMLRFLHFSKDERIKNKIEAKRLASKADWKLFVENYITAHNLAVKRRWS
jgi:glycogen(starch) synthase